MLLSGDFVRRRASFFVRKSEGQEMEIKRIDEMLAIYDENFPDRSEIDPRLEVILAQALLVVIYSEF